MASARQKTMKIILQGDSGVGTLQIRSRMIKEPFVKSYPAMAPDFRIRDEENLKVQIWAEVRDSRFRTISQSFYRGVDVALIVYDVTNRESYDHVDTWMAEVARHCAETTKIILVANKYDLVDEMQVTSEEAERFAARHKIPFFEISAKTGTNIEALFHECLNVAGLSIAPDAVPKHKVAASVAKVAAKVESKTIDKNERAKQILAPLTPTTPIEECIRLIKLCNPLIEGAGFFLDDGWKALRNDACDTFLKIAAGKREEKAVLMEAQAWSFFKKPRKPVCAPETLNRIKNRIAEIEREEARARVGAAAAPAGAPGRAAAPSARPYVVDAIAVANNAAFFDASSGEIAAVRSPGAPTDLAHQHQIRQVDVRRNMALFDSGAPSPASPVAPTPPRALRSGAAAAGVSVIGLHGSGLAVPSRVDSVVARRNAKFF